MYDVDNDDGFCDVWKAIERCCCSANKLLRLQIVETFKFNASVLHCTCTIDPAVKKTNAHNYLVYKSPLF